MALTRLYDLHSPLLASLHVKGELIVPTSTRIMTRSRAKKEPDRFTSVSAQVKILQVLVEELLPAQSTANLDELAEKDDDCDEDDGDWEDEGGNNGFLDLGSGMTKAQLMAYAAEDEVGRERGGDDETQSVLVGWLRGLLGGEGGGEAWGVLTAQEREKVQEVVVAT